MKSPFSKPVSAEHYTAPSNIAPASPASFAQQQASGGYFEGATAMAASGFKGLLAEAKRMAGFDKKGLPDAAKNKMLRIAQAGENARGARERARASKEELQEELARMDLNISITVTQISARCDDDRERANTEKTLLNLQADRDIIQAAITKQLALQAEQGDIFVVFNRLSESLSTYVARIATRARSHSIVVEPRIEAGKTAAQSVERLRTRISELRADLSSVVHAPYPSSEAKQRMRAEIDELAERGKPRILNLINRREEIQWPTQTMHVVSQPIGDGDQSSHLMSLTTPDAIAIVAWAHRDVLIARLDEEIESCSTDTEALTDEQRSVKTAAISADILAIEREEEVLIERMEQSGAMFLRRPDADPRAILGLSSDMPAPDADTI